MKNKDWFNIKNAKITYKEQDDKDFELVVETENRDFLLKSNIYVGYAPEIEIYLIESKIWLFLFFEEMPLTKFADLPTHTIQNIFEKWIIERLPLAYFEQQIYLQQSEYFEPYKLGGKEQIVIYEKLKFEKRLQENHKKRTHLPQIYDALSKTNLLNIFRYCTSHASFILEILNNKNVLETYFRLYYDDIKNLYIARKEEEKLFFSFETLSELIVFLEDNYIGFIESLE